MRIAALLASLVFTFTALAADVTGKWTLTAKTPGGDEVKAELILKEDGGKLAGTVSNPEGAAPLREVEFKDNTLTGKLTYMDTPVKLNMKLDGDKLSGVYATDSGETGEVQALRQPVPNQKDAAPGVGVNPAGVWKLTTNGPDGGEVKLEVTLKLDGGQWSGRMVIAEYNVDIALTEIHVAGADVSFKVPTDNGTYNVTAKVTGGKMEGTSEDPNGTKVKIVGSR
jgi:hypothetical protein